MSKIFNIYCDESHQDSRKDKYPYLVLGSLLFEREQKDKLKEGIKKIQIEYNIKAELKWSKVSNISLEGYKKLIDLFFESQSIFKCIVLEKSEINLEYHESNANLAFFKFIYQLLKNIFEKDTQYYVFLDYKPSSKKRYTDLTECITRKAQGKKGTEIKKVQAYHSHENIFLQWVDVFCGIVASSKNNTLKPNSAKSALVKHVLEKLNKANFNFSSPPWESKFNVFHLKPGYKQNKCTNS